MATPEHTEQSRQTVVRVLYVSAAVTAVIAIVLGALVAVPLYAILLISVIDLVLAWAFRSGKIAPPLNPKLVPDDMKDDPRWRDI